MLIKPLVLLLVCLATQVAEAYSADWKVTTLAKGGEYNSIAIDPSGRPHISYLDDSNPLDYALRHAFLAGKSWRTEIVDSGDVGWWNSIATDSLGQIHISYLADKPSPSLKYAHFNGTSWTNTTVDSTGGYSTSIALDSLGRPHIAYVDFSGNLKHASLSGTAWTIETIPGESGLWFGRTSLAIGSADEAFISFSNFSREIRLATNSAGFWEVETVGSGIQSSLALDSAGNPHIVYNSESVQQVLYATQDGAIWTSQSVTSGVGEPGVGESPALALDSHDLPHVSFGFYASNFDVEVMLYAKLGDTGWEYVLVDPKNAGFQSSISLDQWDLPHVSYRKAIKDSSQLKYADSGIKPPEIQTLAFKNAHVGRKYAVKLKAKNGGRPYTWEIIAGELPPGLRLDSLTGAISGVPSVAGTFEFDVQVTDVLGLAREASFSFLVQPQ